MNKPHHNNLHWIKHVDVFETCTTQKIVNVQNFPKMVGIMSSSATSSICWWWLKPICIKWLMLITRMESSNLFLDIMFCLCLRLKLLHRLQVSLMGQRPPRLHHHCQSLQWEPASSLQTHYQTFSSAGVRCLLCQAANSLSFCTRTAVVGCWALLLTSSPLPSQSSTWQEGSWLHVNFFPHYTTMLSADTTSRNYHFCKFFHSPITTWGTVGIANFPRFAKSSVHCMMNIILKASSQRDASPCSRFFTEPELTSLGKSIHGHCL